MAQLGIRKDEGGKVWDVVLSNGSVHGIEAEYMEKDGPRYEWYTEDDELVAWFFEEDMAGLIYPLGTRQTPPQVHQSINIGNE